MAFDDYTGPVLARHTNGRPIVPIPRKTRDFFRSNAVCQRTQFPLAVAHAITVHKSQSLTIDRVVCDITSTEFQPGLTYVAVSRVKTLQGIVFEAPFDLDSLRKRGSRSANADRLQDWQIRTAQLLLPPPSPL